MDQTALSQVLQNFLVLHQPDSIAHSSDLLSAAISSALADIAQETSTNTTDTASAAALKCQIGNDFNGHMSLRISSIFVILVAGSFGALFPVISSNSRHVNIHPIFFFVAKYFGSGVIVATALIHLLQPGSIALSNPCLGPSWLIYPYAYGIALVSLFATFLVELLSRRYLEKRGITHSHGDSGFEHHHDQNQNQDFSNHTHPLPEDDHAHNHPEHHHHQHIVDLEGQEGHIHTHSDFRNNNNGRHFPVDDRILNSSLSNCKDDHNEEIFPCDYSSRSLSTTSNLSGGVVEIANNASPNSAVAISPEQDAAQERAKERGLAMQLGSIFILEFGILFHSIFIGLSLAVSGNEFTSLYIVLVFHQLFEGLGLGTRIALAPWPHKKWWLPWALCVAFGLTTPIAIAIGLGVRNSYPPGSYHALVINGVFDSISAGILLYVGLVELIGSEFMHNEEVQHASTGKVLFAYGCMCTGAALMALLALWI
ncbi:uncharacterized protein SAPINGB_P004873 [Magnusiomyces paraingens]|uniref:Uncharacterized protein n=1 Tax=Magnusiomyces paraingens TaxID=2606893 RepID=A0A5E8C4U1_9ASCO|nr:uncharacterized protein SAPINGB_P004873 [Saprochaete ingens]VVT56166.1 unnamed protein product [Saprochaete ingens]